MSNKKYISYVLALAGLACTIALSLFLNQNQINSYEPNNEMTTHEKKISSHENNHVHNEDDHEEDHNEDVLQLTKEQVQQIGLQYKIAGPGILSQTLSTRGKIILHPDGLAHIIPKVSGVAREVNKNIGDFVKTKDVLAVLESNDMADVKASYLAALSKKRLAASSLEREEKLYQERVSAGQDYLNAKNIYEESMISVHLARQKLHAFGLNSEEIEVLTNQNNPDLRLYSISSPIDGTIIMRHITKGEFVETTTTIFEIADLSKVWVEIGIYPKDLYRVKEGQMVEVFLPNESKGSAAKLIYVSPIVADETITAKAVAELDNSQGNWKPGFFVKVDVATEKRSLPLVIPKEAIQNSEGKDFVFIVTSEGFEKRFIKVGQSDTENSEVLSGLNQGEQYVANKTFLLKAELGKNSAEHEH